MKKQILFLGLLLVVFGLQIDAQTLKNIHRHNLPVLRVPTHLIDKVETVEVNGERVLKVIQVNGYVSQIPVSQIDSITHSLGEAVDPAQLGSLRTASVMGVVTGPTGAPEMNAIVRSPYGGEVTQTDPNGVFFLNNILVYDKLGYITITKPGFHQGSRSFLPLVNGSNRVNVQLLSMSQSGTFFASEGGTVTSGLLQLSFPANAIQLNGQPYTGTVKVFAAALDPTSTAMFDQMPGELLGGMNDSLRLLRSFGMASIELRDANMNELQLADNMSASLTFSIPSPLQADAPQTIDWWSFDENLGYWKHEGEATKQGTQYVGQASHFSWWNCDVPENFNDINGTVNSADGTPVSDALVNVVTQTLGTGVTYTNSEGVFSGRVPKNQLLTLNIYLTCSTTNEWTFVNSETISSLTQALNTAISASLNDRYPIIGTIVDCEVQPVSTGYIRMGAQIFFTQNGNFTIQACQIGEYTFRGYNTSNLDTIKVSEFVTLNIDNTGADAGTIHTCSLMYGLVNDIEGNIYSTVLIGEQWWMAENLRTSVFSDSSIINHVIDSLEWVNLNTPAWCNSNNNSVNDSLYGKLYNWYTVSDLRNVCPTGWHVPNKNEFIILRDYLGGGSISGRKLKSTTGWLPSNWTNWIEGGTNESGFSASPGGVRNVFNNTATFYTIGYRSEWWSSALSGNNNEAWQLYITYNFDAGNLSEDYTGDGKYIRCIKN